MSAIAGILYLDRQPVERDHLAEMLDILSHRGSDGANIWCGENVGFIHRMLWTTPESLLETLPLEKDNLVITADARIDNRDELISILEINHLPKERITDNDLILAAYQKWGEKCPEKLLGDFAFAIWDKQEQQLFCARDHFGVKPFYYYLSEKKFVFATEIKAILCISEASFQVSEVRIGDYLASLFEDKEITFYENILRLPPASQIILSAEKIEIQSYWSLNQARELKFGSDQEYADKFREIFTEAVRCRLRSAVPLGTMLSGGLDSSSITCTARRIMTENSNHEQLPTFSAIFDEVKECDEQPYINAVLSQGGYKPNYIYGDKLSPLTDIEKVLWHQDEPLYAFNLFLNMGLYDVAQKKGIRVILDGFDGDSTISHGVGYLRDLARQGKWFTLYREIKGYARNFDLSAWDLQKSYVFNYAIDPIINKFKLLRLVRRIWRGIIRRLVEQK
jgi:asparagine synthase (glutamine-hydrolysing)